MKINLLILLLVASTSASSQIINLGEVFTHTFTSSNLYFLYEKDPLSFSDTSATISAQKIIDVDAGGFVEYSFDIRFFENAGDISPFSTSSYVSDTNIASHHGYLFSDERWADLDGKFEIEVTRGSFELKGFGYQTTSGNQVYSSIQPSTVPVPAAVWLFGSGLIGLVGLARRKKA